MIKTLVLVFISVSLCLTAISAAPAQSVDEHMNETSTTTTTTSPTTTTTTTSISTTSLLTTTTPTVITEDASTVVHKVASNDLEESGSSHSLSKEKTVANFAQYNGKLLVNQSAESMNGRIISQQSNSNNNNNNVTAVATNGLSLTVILVLIAAVTMVVSGIILSALFVMRRRFSIWRLNGDSNEESKEIPATSADNQPAENNSKEVLETVNKEELTEVNEKDPELAKQVSTLSAAAAASAAPVDTPVNINCDNGHSNEAATDLCSNEKLSDQQQASPSSSSPLIEKATDEQLASGLEAPIELKEQVTSSSSLIVNVLNELSESVACKLASPNSPTPESSAESDNTETQPLNKED